MKNGSSKEYLLYNWLYMWFKNRQNEIVILKVTPVVAFGEKEKGSDWKGVQVGFLKC